MTLVNSRAAFEKAVTDAVADVDPTITLVLFNAIFTFQRVRVQVNYLKLLKLLLMV
jgi:hypothetical protein